jgi:chromosome segregation ATPase
MFSEVDELRERCAALEAELAETREDLWLANEAYDSLDKIHEEIVAECNELSEQNAILKQDLDDSAIELEGCMAELDIALDALTELGALPRTEADDLKGSN